MTRIGSIAAGWALIGLSALPALAQQTGNAAPSPDYGYYRHMHMWGGGFFFHPLLSLLVIVAIFAILARIFGWRHRGYGRYRGGGGALDILEERFARGEIDKTEFEEKRKLLNR
jgi:putative membrane protein